MIPEKLRQKINHKKPQTNNVTVKSFNYYKRIDKWQYINWMDRLERMSFNCI